MIVIDKNLLEANGASTQTPITLRLKNTPVRQVLDQFVKPFSHMRWIALIEKDGPDSKPEPIIYLTEKKP